MVQHYVVYQRSFSVFDKNVVLVSEDLNHCTKSFWRCEEVL